MLQAPPGPESVRVDDVRAVEARLREMLCALDPDVVPIPESTELWAAFDTVERLAGSAKTLLARRVEEAGSWRRAGFRSAADQLAGLSGTTVTSARTMLETSKHIEEFPDTSYASRDGMLSSAMTDAIVAAARIAPDVERRLLTAAVRSPFKALRDECLRATAVDGEATYARIRREREVRIFTDPEGAWNLHARGTVDDGAAFNAVFEAIVEAMYQRARAEGREEPREAVQYDAFIELATRATGATSEATKRAPTKLAIIRVDHAALRRGAVEGDEACEIAELGPIPVSVARRELGDAILKLAVTACCTNEQCTRTEYLENDHRHDWAQTHHTRLDELDPLCGHCHDLKTHNGWALIPGKGVRPLVPPDHPRHPRNRPPPS